MRFPFRAFLSKKLVKSLAILSFAFKVTASAGSTPTMAFSRMAASATVRVIGPAVSCVAEIGIIPDRLTSPTVGLMPTMPQKEAGAITEPSVSVPTATAHKLADTATADPELEPQGERLIT